MSLRSIYVEVSDEITTVVERIKGAEETEVAVIAPKGAILLQSIVNLKLAKKAASDAGKKLVLVSTDKIGRNLAVQLGIPVVSHERDAAAALKGEVVEEAAAGSEEPNVIDGVRIHRYYTDDATEEAEAAAEVEPIIIPKKMLQEAPAEVAEPIAVPDTEEPAEAEVEEVKKEEKPAKGKKAAVVAAPITRTSIDEEPAEVTEKEEEEKAVASETAPEKKRSRRLLAFTAFILALLLIGGGIISFLFLPMATATLKVPATAWEKSFDMVASSERTGISEDNTQIPAEIITGEATQSLSFKATGTKKVGDAATGTATLYNYNSTTAQTLPAGSKVVASGKTFTTQAAVTVPGYSQTVGGPREPGTKSVAIIADEVGAESNLTDATANDIVSAGINLSAKVTTAGGSSREVKVVSANDVTAARNALSTQLRDAAKQDVNNKIGDRSVSYNEQADSFALDTFTTTVAAGTEAEGGDANGKGSFKRLIVDAATMKAAAEQRVKSDQKPATNLIIDSVDVTNLTVDGLGKQATLSISVKGKESAVIPTESLRQNISGKSEGRAREIAASLVSNGTLDISYKPAWWPVKRLPYSPKYLKLDIQYE